MFTVTCVRIYQPKNTKVCLCGCECVLCVQECVSMITMEAEGPPLRPPSLLHDVPAAGPDARELVERRRPGGDTQWVLGLVW